VEAALKTETETLRLGYLLSQYPAVNHTFILREIRALRCLGFDITAVSIRPSDRPLEALSAEEAEEFRLTWSILGNGPWRVVRAHLRTAVRRPLAYLASLLYALRLAGWDLRASAAHLLWFAEAVAAGDHFVRAGVGHVHSHFSSTVALLMARLFPVRFSVTVHGPDEFNDVAAFHMAEKVAQSAFVAAISRYAASQTMRAADPRDWPRIRVLPLGVDLGAFVPGPRREAPGRLNLLCVGRLAPVKAHLVLFDAVRSLVDAGHSHLRLTVVGGGPSRPLLERAIAEAGLAPYIHLTGACNSDRIAGFLRETDIFALPSFAEGVPIVLMEAMAMEIPCVTTWVAGIPELIRDQVDGLLVPPADPGALAAAIATLAADPDLRVRLGVSARERVAQSYDLSNNATRLAAVFRGEIGPQAPRISLPHHPC
jgi:colanic acid/amylovoran biosynthesis glycosyltransferase